MNTATRQELKEKRRMKMVNLSAARGVLNTEGISLKENFHTLRPSQVEAIVQLAKESGYRKPRNANGSTGRYYFQALARKARIQ